MMQGLIYKIIIFKILNNLVITIQDKDLVVDTLFKHLNDFSSCQIKPFSESVSFKEYLETVKSSLWISNCSKCGEMQASN